MSGMQTASTVLFLIGGLRTVLLLVALGPTLIVQAILDGNVIVIITVHVVIHVAFCSSTQPGLTQ